MRDITIRLFFYSLIALIPISCGSRKVNTGTSVQQQESKYEEKNKTSVSKETQSKEDNEEDRKSVSIMDKQNSRVVETYYDNGWIKSRMIENLNSKNIYRSADRKTSKKAFNTRIDSTFTNKIYKSEIHKNYSKQKNTQTSNSQVYWMLFGLGVIAIVAVFVYKWLKQKVNL